MENYIMLHGIRIDISDEHAQQIIDNTLAASTGGKTEEKKSPFDTAKKDGIYYFVSSIGTVHLSYGGDVFDTARYNVANYCTVKSIMEQRALHETLDRLLWRYSEMHGGDSEWDGRNYHWWIYRETHSKRFGATANDSFQRCNGVYFRTKETAQAAIHDIVEPFLVEHPDFVW